MQSPIAEFVESNLHFTQHFPSITANSISIFHCFLSIVCVKFFSSESLFRRRIGVLIFEFRSFLDCLDGVVFRANKKFARYKSYHNEIGYYIDGLSDVLGGTCLIIGCYLYFNKHRPSRSKLHPLHQPLSVRTSRSNELDKDEEDSIMINLDDEKKSPCFNEINTNILETKQRIFAVFALFGLRYALAAVFWDKSVQAYENLLDSHQDTLQKQVRHRYMKVF